MRLFFILASLLLICNCSSSISTNNYSDTHKTDSFKLEYLNKVFEIIETHSIRKDSINLKGIKEEVLSKIDTISTLKDCHSVVASILIKLGDNHSFFVEKEELLKWNSEIKSKTELFTFNGKLLNNNFGYINLKGFDSGDSVTIIKYADSLQRLIKLIDNENIKGWIIDLRNNTGGNCWPMLAGLGPILGEGVCGFFVNCNKKKAAWYYINGAAGEDDLSANTATKISGTPYNLINPKTSIAVLIGPNTASSGELIAIAFHGKTNTKSFGKATYGLSTVNETFILSDSSAIFLTTKIDTDRDGIVFGKEIVPDFIIEPSSNMIQLYDSNVQAAINWLNNY